MATLKIQLSNLRLETSFLFKDSSESLDLIDIVLDNMKNDSASQEILLLQETIASVMK